MIRLAIGMLFILVNFAPEIGNLSINLLPEFVGYIFILSVSDKLAKKSDYFKGLSGMLFLMIVYKVVDYIIMMFALDKDVLATVFFWLGIVMTILSLVIQFRVYCGIDEIAYDDDVRVNTSKIFLLFKVQVVLTVLAYVNTIYRIYLNYSTTGEIIPGLSRPVFRLLSKFPEEVLGGLDIFGSSMILAGVVVKMIMVVFVFGVCSDYDKIMNSRSGKRD
ncbi:MAG: hypothetical protein J6B39_05215 [Lachnospiraceae bacterium]|nr:hypothetical protein [Lachnospiraceae bacterium]